MIEVNAFWLGVLVTIGAELLLVIGAAFIHGGKKK